MNRRKLITILATIGIIAALVVLLVGCSKEITTTTTQTTTQTSTTTTTTTAKVLKIGIINYLGWPPGITEDKVIKILADDINKKGGVTIGNEIYTLQVISYDTQNSQETAVAAANRMVYQDGVKFILSDGRQTSGFLDITDAEKVVVICGTPDPSILNPKYKYVFNATSINTSPAVTLGWFAKNHPEFKNYVAAFTDDREGHMINGIFGGMFTAFNIQKTDIFYPAQQTDLSAVATQAMQLKPDVFIWQGSETTVVKSMKQAGYNGQLFAIDAKPFSDLTRTTTPQELEGLIDGALPTEFDPPLTQGAIDFKALYTAVTGKWDDPALDGTVLFNCLIAGLQQAGSIDTDKVAAKISSGMEFDTPLGVAKMIPRADMGSGDRTVDLIVSTFIKQINNGQPEIIATIDPEEGMAYCATLFKAK